MPILIGFLLLFVAPLTYSHSVESLEAALHWSFEPWVVALIALSFALYVIGLVRLRSHTRSSALRKYAIWFFGGLGVLVLALESPLDALGSQLFSAHMLQHELLMIVAAPMLVLGRPLAIWTWAFARDTRLLIARILQHPWIRGSWGTLTMPVVAWILHALALWLWHVPAFFTAALENDGIHTFQHFSFLFSALLFWWTVFGHRSRAPQSALAYLFTTMVHTGALGALLVFSSRLWYPVYEASNYVLGFDPQADQQLGGLIMWVPGGLVYVLAGLALAARFLHARDRSYSYDDIGNVKEDGEGSLAPM